MILKVVLRLVVYAIAILVIARVVPGIHITSFYAAKTAKLYSGL